MLSGAPQSNSLLIVTFDEPEKYQAKKKHSYYFLWGQNGDYIDHLSVLKFILKSNQAGKNNYRLLESV
jgi:hypothetical protein